MQVAGVDQALRRAACARRRFVCRECRRGARPDRTQRRGQDHACWKRSPALCPRTAVTSSGAATSPALSHRREFMFYLPDGLRPWEDEYVARVLEFFAAAYGRPASITAEAIGALGLAPVLRKRVGALSKGYGRRLMLALALITPQPLLLMDEPFDGFDLRQTREIMGVVRDVARNGRTLVSGHSSIDRRRAGLRPLRAARGRPGPRRRHARGAARADRDARGRIGGRLPCAHLTPSSFARAPLRPLLAKELREIVSGRALWTMLLILCPLVGYSFWQAVRALRRSKRGRARCARACERALAARRRAGPHLRCALRRRHPAVSVRGHSQPRPRKGNRRAAPAGAVALPGADADRRQDDGDLRRLAGRAHSRGLGRW